MEEKEFRKGKLPPLDGLTFGEKESGIKSKIAGFPGRIFSIIKFLLGVSLLPFVYSATLAFLNEASALEKTVNNYFGAGIISFLAIYLFIWEPAIIYYKGQKILAAVFRFFTPLVKVAPHLLPIYTIILFIICNNVEYFKFSRIFHNISPKTFAVKNRFYFFIYFFKG